VRFLSADVRLEDVRHTGKTTTVVTTFLGRVYLLEFAKEFPTDLVLLQPTLGRAWGFGSHGYEKVSMESIEFNQELLVLAKDPLSAFEILTPPMMEKLLWLDSEYQDRIGLSIQGKRLWVAVETRRDHFEIQLFKPLPDSFLPDLKNEMETVRGLTSTLKK